MKKSKSKSKAKPKPEEKSSVPVCDFRGRKLQTLTLDPLFQNGAVNSKVVYGALLKYRAGEREGTASTKDRGHVRGGGKKPWRQKGTGRARHGSRRSPIWRGGGVTFGPMPRDYSYPVPSKVRRRAVAEVVKDKALAGRLFVVEKLDFDSPRTKLVADFVSAWGLKKPLLVVEKRSRNLDLASRNLAQVRVKTAGEVNALDVASCRECVMTQAAYAGLVRRLKG